MRFNTRSLSITLSIVFVMLNLLTTVVIGVTAWMSWDGFAAIPVKTWLAIGLSGVLALGAAAIVVAAVMRRAISKSLADEVFTPLNHNLRLIRRLADGECVESSEYPMLQGELARHDDSGELTTAVRTLHDQIRLLFQETDRLTAAVQSGRLDVRGNVQPLSGKWREMLLGLNAMLDTSLSPMTAMADAMQRISNGEMTARLTAAYQGDFAAFQETFNTMLDTLRDVVQHFKTAADGLAGDSQELSVSSERMVQGAITQAASTEEVAASTEEMAANIRQSANNALQTEKIAAQVAAEAQRSSQAFAQAVSAMHAIAKKIAVIDEIGRQTQVLSLNASIEAAKAQDYGKGFAVVSSAVRALAKRTRLAAKEITDLVNATLNASEDAAAMLNHLTPEMQMTANLIEQISRADHDHSLSVEQMSSAIQQLDEVIQRNVTTSEDISSTAQELAMQAKQLQEVIAFFQFDETSPREQRADAPRLRHTLAPAALTPDSSANLTIGISQEIADFHPILNAHISSAHYLADMYARPFVSMTVQGEWIPMLITDIPTLDNGQAELYTDNGVEKIRAHCELREGLKWGDGVPITNQDVLFAWQVGTNKHIRIMRRKKWTIIERVEPNPLNDRQFTVYFAQASWKFNQLYDYYLLPKHLEEPVFRQWGNIQDGYAHHTHYADDPLNPGLYSGPYRLADIKPGSHLLLKSNPYFYGKPPYFQQVTIKFIPDTRTLETHLTSGSIDMIATRSGLSTAQASAFEQRIKEKQLPYRTDFIPGIVYEHILLQLRNPLLQDVRVRKALVYAINRDAMCQALFGSKQVKAIHLIPPNDPQYIEDTTHMILYDYAPYKANALLDDAGWEMSVDGYRRKEGQKLSFQLATSAGNKSRELMEEYLQQEWKKVGIEIRIENAPASEFFEVTLKARFAAMAILACTGEPDMDLPHYLHSRSIPCEQNAFSGANISGWANPQVDRLLEQLEREFRPEKRQELIADILHYYTDEVPAIPLCHPMVNSAHSSRLAGYEISPYFITEANRIEYWHLTT